MKSTLSDTMTPCLTMTEIEELSPEEYSYFLSFGDPLKPNTLEQMIDNFLEEFCIWEYMDSLALQMSMCKLTAQNTTVLCSNLYNLHAIWYNNRYISHEDPKLKRVQVLMSESCHRVLKQLAARDNTTMSEYMHRCTKMYIHGCAKTDDHIATLLDAENIPLENFPCPFNNDLWPSSTSRTSIWDGTPLVSLMYLST